jgi:hypothetical protein
LPARSGHLARELQGTAAAGAAENQGHQQICGVVAVASTRAPRLLSITVTHYAALAAALVKTVELANPRLVGPETSRGPSARASVTGSRAGLCFLQRLSLHFGNQALG